MLDHVSPPWYGCIWFKPFFLTIQETVSGSPYNLWPENAIKSTSYPARLHNMLLPVLRPAYGHNLFQAPCNTLSPDLWFPSELDIRARSHLTYHQALFCIHPISNPFLIDGNHFQICFTIFAETCQQQYLEWCSIAEMMMVSFFNKLPSVVCMPHMFDTVVVPLLKIHSWSWEHWGIWLLLLLTSMVPSLAGWGRTPRWILLVSSLWNNAQWQWLQRAFLWSSAFSRSHQRLPLAPWWKAKILSDLFNSRIGQVHREVVHDLCFRLRRSGEWLILIRGPGSFSG